jgi:hypothetical protein
MFLIYSTAVFSNVFSYINKKIIKCFILIIYNSSKDGISVKILKIAKPIVSKPITMLINKTIENASFPNKLKDPIFNNFQQCSVAAKTGLNADKEG